MNTTNSPAATLERMKEKVVDFATDYGIQIIGALLILAIGVIIAWWVGKSLIRWLEKKRIEPPLVMLAVRIVRLLIFGLALVLAAEKAGVPIAPMVAGIGVAGVGIGLAMQGVLGNLVAGLTIIFTKPFRVNEYIEILSVQGQVTKIELFTTTLIHADRSRVVIPNRKIVGEVLHNYGTIRQLDLSVGVGYGTDLAEALRVIGEILKNNPLVLRDPAPVIGVGALGDSSIYINVRPWTNVGDFGPASAQIYQAIVNQFRERKIEIPFPQREVRLLNSN